MKEKTCCFTIQNRQTLRYIFDENNPNCIKFILRIALEIEYMTKKGCHTFITGMDLAPELWFAETVLDFQRAYPHKRIRLIVVEPPQQAFRCNKNYLDRYERVFLHADDTLALGVDDHDGYMQQIDPYMIKRSSHKIALLSGGQDVPEDTDQNTTIIDPAEFFGRRPLIFSIVR